MSKITLLSKQTTPLCFLSDGRLVCYKHGDIIIFKDGDEVQRISLFKNIKESILGKSKLISRFLRLGIRYAEALDDSTIVLSVGNYLYELHISDGQLSKGYYCGEGVRPLTITNVNKIDGIDDGLYFGGYVRNFEKAPVSIYHRVGKDNWEIVYTFPQGAINHVHNVIADPYRQCLWVFTGDFGNAAAIWRVSDGFKRIECMVSGEQKWRGCIAFATPEGVLYATDAPYAPNHIFLLKDNGAISVVGDLPGSCIYGCQWSDGYVFSTAVEADGRNETMIKLLLGWKRGAGIRDNYAHILFGNVNNGFSEIYKEKKDYLPFIFQFGAFKFPTGINDSDMLYYQSIGTMKNDMDLICLKK